MNDEELKIKLRDIIKKCIYYKENEYVEYIDEFDNSILFNIYFNMPYNDLKRLFNFCFIHKICIEFHNKKILISIQK